MKVLTKSMEYHVVAFAIAHEVSLIDAWYMLYATKAYGSIFNSGFFKGLKLDEPLSVEKFGPPGPQWSKLHSEDGFYLNKNCGPYPESSNKCVWHLSEKKKAGDLILEEGWNVYQQYGPKSSLGTATAGLQYTDAAVSSAKISAQKIQPLDDFSLSNSPLYAQHMPVQSPPHPHLPKWACKPDGLYVAPSTTLLSKVVTYGAAHKMPYLIDAWNLLRLNSIFTKGPAPHLLNFKIGHPAPNHYEGWKALKEMLPLHGCEPDPKDSAYCICLKTDKAPVIEGQKFDLKNGRQMVLQVTDDEAEIAVPEGFKIVVI